ncbi:MAG TPA: translocation/assembly module TamB domain-containing protein [Vicinamibacterales bacterium]
MRRLIRALGLILAIVVAGLMTSLTIDLGPSLKKRAEKAGSDWLDRPMHMGYLGIHLASGSFEVRDLVIDGLKPGDHPFLTARRITVYLPWWTIFTHELIVDTVEMSDWDMLVEQFPGGKHSFPRVTGPKRPPRTGEPRFKFTTTTKLVIARNGRFTYDDHGTPWRVVCPNLSVSVFKGVDTYRGTAQFSKGSVKIQNYEEFPADFETRFRIEDGKVQLESADIQSRGASTAVTGYVDLRNWPDMLYNVKANVDFPTWKAVFFKDMNFSVTGAGQFAGTFRFFKQPDGTGRELKGSFTSAEAGVNAWRFGNVHGSLLWDNHAFRVTDVTTGLYGGRAKFDYLMEPIGEARPAQAVWDATYADVDLHVITDFLQLQGIRLEGRAAGRNRLEWPLGRFAEKHGSGQIVATMSGAARPMTRALSPDRIATVDPLPPEYGPFNPQHPLGYLPVAGSIGYTLTPQWITVAPGSWAATEKTYVEFSGQTAWADRSTMPFHVTSLDWLESDRLLAGIMTAFGSPTGTIDIGGRGEFDGTMLGAFRRPRIEGHFAGDRLRAWDTVWGHLVSDLVIENSYVDISHGVITKGDARIDTSGRFSLGYPRQDNGEEINADVQMRGWPLVDLRHAFELDDWPVDGSTSGTFRIHGHYQTPFGSGRLQVDGGRGYGESFESATSNLAFEGNGVRMESFQIRKASGAMTGAAWIGWDGTYSFDANGVKIPVESLDMLAFPKTPLSGILDFTATGAGSFGSPRYDVKATIADLFVKDEGVGLVSGTLSLRNDMVTLTELNAQSRRLSVTGQGQLALNPERDVDLTLRFSDTSLDPYLRLAAGFSPFNTIIADGVIRARGELSDIDHLVVETTVDRLQLKLFDYPATNDGPIQLALDQHVVEVRRFKLTGEGTALDLSGSIDLHQQRIALEASGDASLGILQAFYPSLRTSGTAALHAQVRGGLDHPEFSGDATISGGRLLYSALPQSLQDFNGRLVFDAQGIRIVDASGQIGGGRVTFGGRIGLNGFRLGAVDLTAAGDQMHLRYPEGFRSTVDADLTLRGDLTQLVVGGNVTILDGVYTKRFEPNVDIFSMIGGTTPLPQPVSAAAALPVRYDVHVLAPGTLRLENNVARIASRADLTLNGTYDKPVLFGRADIERGEIIFEGNRYRITRGTIDFEDPTGIKPFFDIEAEARIRSTSQSIGSTISATDAYRVTLGVSGSLDKRLNLSVNSDPPLPTVDVIALVFGQPTGDLSNPELRSLSAQATAQTEEQLLRSMFVRMFTNTLTAPLGRAVEQSLGIDTVQIMPGLGSSADPLTPTARLILGKRISNRAYLTYSKALSTTTNGDQVIVLEYDQSDRLGWVLTQTGAYTFAIDFRVRRVF